jgi:hypothetical protein
MTLYSYIVTHDTGFAPNPFFGYCTLACCKPGIRKHAKEGDWIVGLTPKADGNKIVYFMQVDECKTFGEYWRDGRFKEKKPKFGSGVARKLGDNIYEPDRKGNYSQLPSAHSSPPLGKRESREAMAKDLNPDRVLISQTFAYFGAGAVALSKEYRCLIAKRNHKCRFDRTLVERFVHEFVPKWKLTMHGRPLNPPRTDEPFKTAECSG